MPDRRIIRAHSFEVRFLLSPPTQVFGLTVIPVLVATVWALITLANHPDNENDRAAARALNRVAPALEQVLAREGEELERLGGVISRNPQFFAVLNLPRSDRAQADFKNALENVLRDFQRDADTPIFEVMDETGNLLARALQPATGMTDIAAAPFVRAAVAGRTGHGYMIEKGRVYRVATVPVSAGGRLIGVLCLGRSVDTEMAERLKATIGCDVAFTVTDEIQATTLTPSPLRKILAQRVNERSLAGSRARKADDEGPRPAEFDVITTGGERFVAIRRALQGPSIGGELAYLLIRPLVTESSPLAAIQRELLYAGGAGSSSRLGAGAYLAIDTRAGAAGRRTRTTRSLASREYPDADGIHLDRFGESWNRRNRLDGRLIEEGARRPVRAADRGLLSMERHRQADSGRERPCQPRSSIGTGSRSRSAPPTSAGGERAVVVVPIASGGSSRLTQSSPDRSSQGGRRHLSRRS